MSRLTPLKPSELDDAQRKLYDTIDGARPGARQAQDGSLIGPFDAFLRNPNTGARMLQLGSAMRFDSNVPRRAIEIAILCVGRKWEAEFEWWAHVRLAREVGVEQSIIDAILTEQTPVFSDAIDAAVYHGVQEILINKGLSNGAYNALKELVGEGGLLDLFTLVGYYTTISIILNGFRVPLPEGEANAFG